LASLSRPAALVHAAIYIRVSSASQAERKNGTTGEDGEQETSLDTQESACRRHAADRGFVIDDGHVFREVHTGTQLWERPRLTELRELVRQHAFGAVIAYSIDRLSRDPVHLGVIISEAEHAGADVQFVTEPLDHSPEGQLIRFVRGYAAKVEHEKIRERVQRGKLARVRAGKLMHAWKPKFGYQWRTVDKTAYEIDEATATIVRRIFDEAVTHRKSLRQIKAALDADLVPTPLGRLDGWRESTLAQILHDPAYIGRAFAWRLMAGKTRNGKDRNHLRDEADWIALPDGTIPPIVEEETWNAAQAIIARNKLRRAASIDHAETHLLRGGYAVCGHCGSTMVADWPNSGKAGYACGVHRKHPDRCTEAGFIRATILDAAVWARVEDTLLRPETIRDQVAALRRSNPTNIDLPRLNRGIADVDRKVANLVRRLSDVDDEHLAQAVTAQLAALSAQKRELESQRAALLARRVQWEAVQGRLESLEEWCTKVAKRLGTFSYEQKRLALDALGVKVRVYAKGQPLRYEITAEVELVPEGVTAFGIISDSA
jgi:site-specific DNA recombinase